LADLEAGEALTGCGHHCSTSSGDHGGVVGPVLWEERMLPRNRATPRTTRPAETLSDAVVHFVVSFVRVIRTCQLYPSDHRFVKEGFRELVEHLRTLLGIRDEVTFGFREDAVLFEDQVLLRGHPTVASLRHYLEDKNIESVTIDREVELFELRAVADLLAKHRGEVMKEGHIDERLLQGLSSIRLNEVTYRRVEGDGGGEGSAEPSGAAAGDARNPFLHLDRAGQPGAEPLGRQIAEDPRTLSAQLLDALRRSIPGFEEPEASVDTRFVSLLERVCLAVLEDPTLDLDSLRSRLTELLHPLAPHLVNRGLRHLLTQEMGYDVGKAFPRFTLPSRSRMLLTEARLHGDRADRLREALDLLGPTREQARLVLEDARDVLPRARLPESEERRIRESLDRMEKPQDVASEQGLVVIAEPKEREAGLLRMIFERADFDVFTCADGTTALETCLSTKPSLLVLDPALPGVHGLEVLARLKRARPPVPVLLVSEHEGFRHDYAVSTYPRIVCLRKPYDRETVGAAVEHLLGQAESATSPMGPEAVFERAPADGPTWGLLRTNVLEIGVCARGRFKDTFFRILPRDADRSGVFVAEREAGPSGSVDPFRALATAIDRAGPGAHTPSSLLLEADRVLRRARSGGAILSALSLEIDREQGLITSARAGYNAPIVSTPGGAPAELHLPFGPLLGASHTGRIETKVLDVRLPFPTGAAMLLTSTGALEAVGGEDPELGSRLFTGFLRENAARPGAEAMEALEGLLGGLGVRGPGGDLLLLLVRRRS
jgi:CheY-like chemotaxis protein